MCISYYLLSVIQYISVIRTQTINTYHNAEMPTQWNICEVNALLTIIQFIHIDHCGTPVYWSHILLIYGFNPLHSYHHLAPRLDERHTLMRFFDLILWVRSYRGQICISVTVMVMKCNIKDSFPIIKYIRCGYLYQWIHRSFHTTNYTLDHKVPLVYPTILNYIL